MNALPRAPRASQQTLDIVASWMATADDAEAAHVSDKAPRA
jgi:hypothetical protein